MLTLSQASEGSSGSTPPSPRTVATETTDITSMTEENPTNNAHVKKNDCEATKSKQRPPQRDESKKSVATSIHSSASSRNAIRKRHETIMLTSCGPAVNSWESVATSWILPDSAQVIWRVVLATGILMTFTLAMAERPDSVRAFSINAYLTSSFAAIVLLLPCAVALICPDDETVDSKFCTVVWASIVTTLIFAAAFTMTVSTAHIIITPRPDIDWRNLSLVAWLTMELLLGATRVSPPHALVSMVIWAVFLVNIALFDQDPLWLHAFSSLGRSLAFLMTAAIFALWTGFIMAIVTGRCSLTDTLQQHRDEAELGNDEENGDKFIDVERQFEPAHV